VAQIAAAGGAVRSITVRTGPADPDALASTRLAVRLGLVHEVVDVTGEEVSGLADRIVENMDLPTHDGFNSWIVSRAAHEAGLVVALSGLGGDELFGGYPSFRDLPRVVRGLGVAGSVPRRARRLAGSAASSRRPGGPLAKGAVAPRGLAGAYGVMRAMFGPQELDRLGVVKWIGRSDARRALMIEEPAERDPIDRVAAAEIANYLVDQLLRDTDQMSMAHSLEVRVPLLDDRFAATVLSAPAHVRCQPNKQILRRAADLDEPAPKRGFTLPFDDWTRGPLLPFLEEGLISEELPLSWLLDRTGRAALLQAFLEGRTHWSRPWSIAVLRWWCALRGLDW